VVCWASLFRKYISVQETHPIRIKEVKWTVAVALILGEGRTAIIELGSGKSQGFSGRLTHLPVKHIKRGM
jgi:hypothetical protein